MTYLQQAKNIVSNNFPNDKFTLKELTDHGSAPVFLVNFSGSKRFIMRVGERKEPLKNNFLTLSYLKRKTETPIPITFDKLGNIFYSLEYFINGRKHKSNKKEIDLLVKTLRKGIHSHKSKKCGYLSNLQDNWKKYFLKMHVVNYQERFLSRVKDGDKYFNYILSNFPDRPKYFSLLHGDFSFTNSLFYKNKIHFFDFEDSFFGEKEYDLAMLYYMEFLPEKEIIDSLDILDYDKYKILFYALCIGIRKVALARGRKYIKRRIKKLEIVYQHLTEGK